MNTQHDLIRKIYAAFNARDIPAILATFDPQVRWSRAWEGDYATGHAQVRDYWLRQWQELDPHVEPIGFTPRAGGQLEVAVQQLVKDKQGQARTSVVRRFGEARLHHRGGPHQTDGYRAGVVPR